MRYPFSSECMLRVLLHNGSPGLDSRYPGPSFYGSCKDGLLKTEGCSPVKKGMLFLKRRSTPRFSESMGYPGCLSAILSTPCYGTPSLNVGVKPL